MDVATRAFSKLVCPKTRLTGSTEGHSKAQIIDGAAIASKIKRLLEQEVDYFSTVHSPIISSKPKLGYIIVGDRPDSHLYVKMKKRVWRQIGIETTGKHFSESVTQDEIADYIIKLNQDPTVSGILMQLPLPEGIDETALYSIIAHAKDVDGIHPLNMAAMARHEDPFFTPCTPKGIMCLIKSVCPQIRGKKATVIGRSNIVGMPVAMLLQKEFATVTLWHTYTQELQEEVANADILVSATGWPHLVKGDFIKQGAVVIDVGTQFVEDKSRKSGKRLVGDVDYHSVSSRAGHITPVPGGVGPMTIAMLMDNIVTAWKRTNFEGIEDTIRKIEEAKKLAMFTDIDVNSCKLFL